MDSLCVLINFDIAHLDFECATIHQIAKKSFMQLIISFKALKSNKNKCNLMDDHLYSLHLYSIFYRECVSQNWENRIRQKQKSAIMRELKFTKFASKDKTCTIFHKNCAKVLQMETLHKQVWNLLANINKKAKILIKQFHYLMFYFHF